ncbi:enoyl-CoA hydratase/carnithine racemase [Trinickia symbiotica]|uniref:Enoyl-CoA hydratase domain-containing protein 3, mitochondrial n=1 Tax=Trinickia symbiotica TaxID=863227 RepID=A0A2N7X1W2_9BURK|nr:enoyl-CoA hydratase [Trinickia symbiotica]PMS35561.1 enoyl-CoA hydratase [Trinickia symbiotica]PPK47612.1 enoyl-CoA hydratase/carnithine racemase [Trinickia symbiotica]
MDANQPLSSSSSSSTPASGAGVLIVEHGAYGLPGVVRLTLNRPDAFNALSEQLIAELHAALRTIEKSDTRVVVIAAAGRAFCAGHDLKEMRAAPSLEYYRALFARCSELMMTIQRMPQPVIARVHGMATAAGCQLVAMCDLAVAADTARFAVSGINYGLFCATPAVPLSRNLSRKAAFEMLMTGDFIDAAQAREKGLVNRMAPLDALDAEIAELASSICAKPAAAVRAGKTLFYRQLELDIEAAYQLAAQTIACNAMDEAALEGIQAFIEKRKPSWPTNGA